MDNLIALLAAAFALMGSPGPATLSSAATGAAFGSRAAMPYVMGISAGTMTVVGLIALGVTGLVASIPGVAPVITGLAGVYILYLAYKIATAPPLGSLGAQPDPPPFAAGYALAIANPKAYAAIGAVFSGFELVAGDQVADSLAKFATLGALPPFINLFWMRVGSLIAGLLSSPQTSRLLNIGFAAALIASVIAAMFL